MIARLIDRLRRWVVRGCLRLGSAWLRRAVRAQERQADAMEARVLVVGPVPTSRAEALLREAAVDAVMSVRIAAMAHAAYEAGDFAKAARLSDAATARARHSMAQREIATTAGASLVDGGKA